MSHDEKDPNTNDSVELQLISYLDGELDAETSRGLEQRLADDPDLRRRLHEHERAWQLLDELPRSNVDEKFTQTTVEMVAVSAGDDVEQAKRDASWWQRVTWMAGAASIVAASICGYLVINSLSSAANRQLVDDLPVIEHLDAYRYAEDIEFLRALESEGLFEGEAANAL